MKSKLLINQDKNIRCRTLLIFFAGWGMDFRPFENLIFAGCDTLIVWDYSDPAALAEELFGSYDELLVFAWSFGVINAHRFIVAHPDHPITLRVAINGTLVPVDRDGGIAPEIYNATVAGFNETTLEKFRFRMCGSRERYADFICRAPQRDLASLLLELKLMGSVALTPEELEVGVSAWDIAVVAQSDRIFLSQSQLHAWDGISEIIEISGGHMPDFRELIGRFLVDKRSVADHFRKAVKSYAQNASVQKLMAEHLSTMFEKLPAKNILEIGSGTGLLTSRLRTMYPDSTLKLWDLVAQQPDVEEQDAEIAIRTLADESIDLIVSSSTIQWFHSPVSFLKEAYRALAHGGSLCIATFGRDNFIEISKAGSMALRYRSLSEWLRIARSQGWTIASAEEERITLCFDTPTDVIRHMRLTGVNALGSRDVNPARVTRCIIDNYPLDFKGKAPLTYHPLYFILRKNSR